MGPTRAVCRGGACEATADDVDGKPVFVLPETRCLPAMVCDEWKGCASVQGDDQNGWFADQSDEVSRGDPVLVENGCTTERSKACLAAKLTVPGVVCAPHTLPPKIAPPTYGCVNEAGTCRVAKPH